MNRCLDVGAFALDMEMIASVCTYEWKKIISDGSGEYLGTHNLYAVSSSQKQGSVEANDLAELWKIGSDAAKRTLDTCTLLLVCSSQDPTLNKQFSTSDQQLRCNWISANVFMCTLFTSQPERCS